MPRFCVPLGIDISAGHFVPALILSLVLAIDATAEHPLASIFADRGFAHDKVVLPPESQTFPVERLADVRFETIAEFDWFPEGPTYHAADDHYYFSGANALTRVESSGQLHKILGAPGGGGTQFLPGDSVLIIGHVGLRQLFPDGRLVSLADGKEIGRGNDLSVGIHEEIYFSVPSSGIYRLTSGDNGRLQQVADQGCNGLEVDPSGEFLYVVRGAIERYKIDIAAESLGEPETVVSLPKDERGGDGCTFDAWGNLYSMHFRTGVIRVIDPERKEIVGKMPVGVVPASNLTFGGIHNTELFVTAGSPQKGNCQVLKADIGITGFCGHVAGDSYPVIRLLRQSGNVGLQLESSDNK